MQNIKDDIHEKLLVCGRDLVRFKGMDNLTARKLSEASECSIGMIYNQFANMDEFTAEQNEITIDELLRRLSKENYGNDGYCNLMLMIKIFTDFVNDNRELWSLLYDFHLKRKGNLSWRYKRKIIALRNFVSCDFERLFPWLKTQKRRIMKKIFELGLLGFSAMLAADMLRGEKRENRDNLCMVFANTFLAGITLLEDK